MTSIEDYEDIIHLPHHVSKKHEPMDILSRAAQFAPFAALTGYGETINETGRQVDAQLILSSNEIEQINRKLNYLLENKDKGIVVTVVYFEPDKKKAGGAYLSTDGVLRSVYPEQDLIEFEDKRKIRISYIKNVTSRDLDFFDEYID